MTRSGPGRPATGVVLRQVTEEDLSVFFEQQLDFDANSMAAFTAEDPADRAAFDAHWARILGDSGIALRTIIEVSLWYQQPAQKAQCSRPRS